MTEENLPTGITLELFIYTIGGFEQSVVLLILLFKREHISSTLTSIQSTFVGWSIKRGFDQNYCYQRIVKFITYPIASYIIAWVVYSLAILFSAMYDRLPLDHQSHWLYYWPKVSIIWTCCI